MMSRLLELYASFDDLWKGRKAKTPAQLNDMATEMDGTLGKWPEGHGTRQEAVQHFVRLGRKASLGHKDAAPGSPEHMAYRFATDQLKHARAIPLNDTLTGAIDKEHLAHYSAHWQDHFDRLDHAPRVTREINDVPMPVLPGKNQAGKVRQSRTLIGEKRIKRIKASGQSHIATMDDLNTIHTGVERAIQTGKVPEGDANRYHVMRSALQEVHRRHPQTRPGMPFEPSYASMDTTALKVMHTGVEHLDDAGFRETKTRLGPMLASALDAHTAHPFVTDGRRASMKGTVSLAYPTLHPIGSVAHRSQASALSNLASRVGRSRADKETKQFVATQRTKEKEKKAVKAQAQAKAEAVKASEPKSWSEFQDRQAKGESFAPEINTRMERLRRAERAANTLERSLASARLLKALKTWRTS
jgi:hypothetical protein